MNIQNIINDDNHKLIFLKAILLGINYGKSNNSTYYINTIEKEIYNINEKNNINEKKKINEKIEKNKKNDKNENIILKLENQKKYILTLIQKLSTTNYAYNHSKINLLKSNLLIINHEIEKNKKLVKKNENLVGELEKTLSGLSNMLI